MENPDFLTWTDEDFAIYGRRPWVAKHTLHQQPMFSQEGLVELLDNFPRNELQAFTMGHDITNPRDWATVDTGNATGAELWEAVNRGRIWLNLLWVECFDKRYSSLLDGMYGRLSSQVQQLQDYQDPHLTLLISSPNAMVYYHFDAEDNMLWHVRGEKSIWLYPRTNLDLAPTATVEDIFTRSRSEELPYKTEYDATATRFDLKPGDVASWPHNSPHRIVNSDSLNVSLSTAVETPASKRRHLVHSANRWLRNNMKLSDLSTSEFGVMPSSKRFMYRVVKRLGGVPKPPGIEYVASYQIDPSEENGLRKLEKPVHTAFSKAS